MLSVYVALRVTPLPRRTLSWAHRLEPVNPSAAVFTDVKVALGVQRDAERLIELARELSDAAQARHDLAAGALDDVDLRIVLVDHEHERLRAIAGEIDRHRGAAALLDLAVARHGDGFPRHVEGLL